MLLSRTRSNAPGHIAIDDGLKEVTSGSVGSDGRFKLRFHSDTGLTQWARNLQTTIKRASTDCALIPPAKARPPNAQNPRLNIAIHIVGSRGDVQPFIPIAQMLQKPPFGFRVRICTHPVFKDFVESQGIEFFSIGGDPEALMAYMVKNPGLLPNRESVRAGDVGKRRGEMWEIINGCWRSCIEAGNGMGPRIKASDVQSSDDLFMADAIIANPPSMAHIHCAEKLKIPLHMVFTMPWSPTGKYPHPLASVNYGGADTKTANYLSFVMMELLTWQGLGDLINKFRRQKLNLDPISPMWGFQLLTRLQVPFTYLWSESLIPKPADWGSHINITGFSFLPLASSYTPPADLTEYLGKGPPPIYIGFGSIVVDDPDALTRLIFKAVELSGVRAIISQGWSKMGNKDDISDNIYLIGNCPHDWLFQRVSAVVHHGGAGTTAAGIAAGRPTVVVPFFGDQPFWGQMVARAGAGPMPVPYKELTAEKLAESIAFALQPDVQVSAQTMAKDIAVEDGAASAATDLEASLDLGQYHCDICPGRLATHWHKKSCTRLSTFAVACLIQKEIIVPRDIELLRHQSWYVDEGAEHPVIGLAAAVTGTIYALAAATSDYSHAWKYKPQKQASREETEIPLEPPVVKVTTPGDTSNSSTSEANAHDEILPDYIDPKQLEAYARRIAKKALKKADPELGRLHKAPTLHEKRKAAWQAHEQGNHGRAYYVARATGRYTVELTKVGLKAPVAFFYNIANGFHNFPSYGWAGVEVRRRPEITGLASGLAVAGKGFSLGLWDAFGAVVIYPYKGARDGGAKGFGRGIYSAGKGFFSNLGAAAFSLPGYTLKGMEKELQKRHLTKLKAELVLIRLRQAITDFRNSTKDEREEVIRRWNEHTRK